MDDIDIAIIGAGFGGLYALHHLRSKGLRCRVFEAGTGVGGTWYWNRYPGARVDVESLEYSYSFDTELQQDWQWTERYPSQPEVLAYLEHVAEKHDLLRDIQFETHVTGLDWDGDDWRLTTASGDTMSAPYVVTAVGFLSARYFPPIAGLQEGTFQGPVVHTGSWPKEGLDYDGKRIGLVGTGASGVQVLPRVAETAEHLHVFQRSPNWCVPLQNCPMPQEYMTRIKADYDKLRASELASFSGFVLYDYDIGSITRQPPAYDVSAEEREAEYERRWTNGGLCFYNSFGDLLLDVEANKTLQDFVARKIRSIVTDPEIAEALIPKDHPILSKRLCGETGYYEAFNRDNVTLHNARQDPIAQMTTTGVRLESGAEYELDAVIFATGYDAGTGPLTRMDIRGRDGVALNDHWSGGTRTFLGALSHGFPNLFFMDGPQAPSAFFLPPLICQAQAEWIGRVIEQLGESGTRTVEPTPESEVTWGELVNGMGARTVLPLAESNQLMGANVEGKTVECLYYLGGYTDYEKRCAEALSSGDLVFA